MEGVFLAIVVVVVVVVLFVSLRRQRKRAAEVDTDDKSWLRHQEEEDPLERHAPVSDFHVRGNEAIVTFAVPLPEEEDPVLNELLVDEAVEVVREKRHHLPITEVEVIVVKAGQDSVKEVGRARLPSPGELPPPVSTNMLNLTHIAKDPFASSFETDHAVVHETKVQTPKDDLGPLWDSLEVPLGLERGLRARGHDPATKPGPDLIVALLELFDYSVAPLGDPGTYMATKGTSRSFIKTDAYVSGSYPELEEGAIRKFMVEFGTSGADRGLLITDKYGPFMVHDVERNEPRVRFITRERAQRFIDSIALG